MSQPLTDFNDLKLSKGAEAVRDVIGKAVEPTAIANSGYEVEKPQEPARLESNTVSPNTGREAGKARTLSLDKISRIRAMLPFCGDANAHEVNQRIGMTLHHETNGSEQGFELWIESTCNSPKFDRSEYVKRWLTFAETDGARATLASLAYIARGNGWRDDEDPREQFGELAIPGDIHTPVIPADLLPGIAGEMAAAAARATQTPTVASVLCVLTTLAAVLQRLHEVSPYGDDYRETLSLWTLTALPSGARKTAIIGAIAAPLHRYEKLERDRLRTEIARNFATRLVAKKRIEALTQQAAKADDAATRENLRKQIEEEELATPPELRAPRLVTGDVTPERLQNLIAEHGERMTVMSDEPGIFQILNGQYSGGMANIDVFLQAHCGAPFRVDRAGREAHVDRPALSFGLMIQPGILAEVVK